MSDFEVRTAREPDRIVVFVAGECDLRHRDELTACLHASVEAAPLVVVDLAAVRFLDSSGLHALVSAQKIARRRAGNLYAVNARGTVATILDITGVTELLRPPARATGPVSAPDPA
jgi:anti-sigma B factor antagonist